MIGEEGRGKEKEEREKEEKRKREERRQNGGRGEKNTGGGDVSREGWSALLLLGGRLNR